MDGWISSLVLSCKPNDWLLGTDIFVANKWRLDWLHLVIISFKHIYRYCRQSNQPLLGLNRQRISRRGILCSHLNISRLHSLSSPSGKSSSVSCDAPSSYTSSCGTMEPSSLSIQPSGYLSLSPSNIQVVIQVSVPVDFFIASKHRTEQPSSDLSRWST